MEEKKFVGLDGLKYFWTKIEAKVIKIIEDEIAQIIAKAPEDLDTLKEIADWISTHEDSASAMNTAILANTEAISGKADKSHTHTKSQITDFPTSLPANGGTATKATQDGSGNVITSTYVKKSGDTLTGPIVMKANQYTLETAQLDMKNSDIKGANAIWFDDHAEVGEGLKFPRSSGSNYDFMRLDDGKIKVAPNVTGNANTATESIVAYTSDIPTSLPANGGTADKATSVVDYGDTSKTIQIGYAGAGATVDNLSHIAGYLTGGTQIKDVSKSVLQAWLGLSNYLPLSGGTVTGATQFNNYVKLNAWDGYGTGTANLWYDGNNKFVEIQNATDLKLSGVNVSKEGHTHTKSQITDFPTSLPANGGTANSCSGNSATATQLQTARTINIQDSSATYTGTGASFNGSGDATIKLPSIIKANEFKIGNGQQSIEYRSKSFNGYKMHEVQDNALYIEGRETNTGDSGGLAITNDSVTVFGAGNTDGVFRVVNEDRAGNGSETAPAIFNIFKDGNVTMTGRLTAPSATIGDRPVITGSYSNGILNLYTN